MINREEINRTVGEKDSLIVRAFDKIDKSIKEPFLQIRNLFRTLLMAQLALGVVDCASSIPSEHDDTPQCVSTAPISSKIKEVVVCFMRWSDSVALTDELRAQLNAEFALTAQFYHEATFEHDLYKFRLIDPGVVWTGPAPQESLADEEENSAIEACAPQIDDFNQVDTFVVFPSISAGGTPYSGRKTFHTPQGDIEMGIIRLPHYQTNGTKAPQLFQLRHEIGHTRLWNHSKEYACYNDNQQVTYSTDPANCRLDEYGNPYDVMGGGLATPDSHRIFGHPGAYEKSLDGLVKTTTIVEKSGEYALAALEVSCSNVPQLLTIPYSKLPLCLEYRKPIGLDAFYSKDNIQKTFGFESGLPTDGCVFLEICSDRTSILLMQNTGVNRYAASSQKDRLEACIPREGFYNSDLGIDISYSQSTTNPNAVIVQVAGVDEKRLAK